ncbi:MAG: aldose 1-epimerase family protein [Clostridiales bacterium]|nr:aldose 1-epimerase family protein [Clostridiales bacterium]
MFYKIENDFLTCEINDMGAELHSLRLKENGKEYIWFGKKEIWYGQAPVLFPVIGQLQGDKYRYAGKEYDMAKHGFARKMLFNVEKCEGAKAVFTLEDDGTTRGKFPFSFKLSVTFELIGKSVKNTITALNRDEKKMFFSLGAHPGFNCNVGDIIEFEQNETICTERIDSTNLLVGEKFPLLDNEKEIEITKEIFEPDALILSGMKSKKLRIKGENEVEFTFGDCPVLGIWAKPGAPYVCIEPWYGINDSKAPYTDISQKRLIQTLESGKTFDLTWSAKVIR